MNHESPSRRLPRGLVALNVGLLGAIALTLSPISIAQSRQSARTPGDYTVVGGETQSGNTDAIYILDTINRDLIALKCNDSLKQLEGIGYRDLVIDVNSDPDR